MPRVAPAAESLLKALDLFNKGLAALEDFGEPNVDTVKVYIHETSTGKYVMESIGYLNGDDIFKDQYSIPSSSGEQIMYNFNPNKCTSTKRF
jgi:hypothetical protein